MSETNDRVKCDYCPKLIELWPVIYIGNARVCRDCYEELRGE